jgi:hypothetical protein
MDVQVRVFRVAVVFPWLVKVLGFVICFPYANSLAQENWNRVAPTSAAAGVNGCALESRQQSFYDGYQDTVVFVRIDKQALRLVTDANVDYEQSGAELRVDQRDSIPATGIEHEGTLLFEHRLDDIVEQFIAGNWTRSSVHKSFQCPWI